MKKFFTTLLFSIIIIDLIIIVFDISEKLEDFIQKHAPLNAIIVDFYFNYVPFLTNMFLPLFLFISVIFFTSRLAAKTEIVAILSSGVSYYRFLRPYIIAAITVTLINLWMNNFIIPHSNKKRIEFEEIYIRNPFRNTDFHIHRQIAPGAFIYMERFDNKENIGYKFSYEKFEKENLTYKIMSDNIKWDSLKNNWIVNNYVIREIKGENETLKKGVAFDTSFAFKPEEFAVRDNNIETMDYFQLTKYIEVEKEKGTSNIEKYEIEKHRRIAFPFAAIVLTLIGVSIASRKVRGGIGLHMGLGLLISFTFILFMQVSTTFAAGGILSPFIAVWIPNIIFGALAIYLVKIAQK